MSSKLKCTSPPTDCTVEQLKALIKAAGHSTTGRQRKADLIKQYNDILKAKNAKSTAGAGAGAGTHKSVDKDKVVDRWKGLEIVESSLALRLKAMSDVDRAIVVQIGKDNHMISTSDLKRFIVMKGMLGKGKYGQVYMVCVKNPRTSKCVNVELPSGRKWEVDVAMKLTDDDFPEEMKSFKASTKFRGSEILVRENVINRLLNRLVTCRITPHSNLLYAPVWLGRQTILGFTELSQFDAKLYFSNKYFSKKPKHLRRVYIDTMMAQLLQGLIAARAHLGFSHNDFHYKNAMMNTVKEESYLYQMDIDGDRKQFLIPNHGMLWKIIDTGLASLEFFHQEETASYRKNLGHVVSNYSRHPKILQISPDLYDVVKLVISLKVGGDSPDVVEAMENMLDIAIRASHGLETMGDLVTKNPDVDAEDVYLTVTERIGARHRSSDIPLRRMFYMIASKYECSSLDACKADAVFNTEARLCAKSLSGFESKYFSIDGGSLRYDLKK